MKIATSIISSIIAVAVIALVTANAANKSIEEAVKKFWLQTTFTAQCIDRSGTTFDVSNFVFNFGYSYPTPGWIGKTSRSKDNPRPFIPFSYNGFVVPILFEEINTIEFIDDPPERSSWKWEPSIKIELRDGSTLTGGFGRYGEFSQEFRGETELGSLALDIKKMKKIQFQHKTADHTKRTNEDNGISPEVKGYKDYLLEMEKELEKSNKKIVRYTLTIQTWNDQKLTLHYGIVFRLEHGYRHEDVATEFRLKIGESEQLVGFDKVKKLAFKVQDKPEVELTTVSGKTYPASVKGFSRYNEDLCIGGNIKEFGSGWINLKKVRSISVTK